MNQVRALIFDCDGTLADTMPAHFAAWTITLKQYGLSFPEELFYDWGGVPSDRIARRLGEEQRVPVDAEQIAREKEAAFLRCIHTVRPVPEVLKVAHRYRGLLPMAVASGGFRPVITRILQHLEILNWFAAVVTAEDTVRHKPEPDVFLEAARRLEVEPANCVVFEDTDLGLEAARRAGMRGIDVRPMRTNKGFAAYAPSRP
jgi:beta-phosphoglucomutase family hydrolase